MISVHFQGKVFHVTVIQVYTLTSNTEEAEVEQPLTVWITTNWKILKEMGIPNHLSASWEICMQVRKQQLKLDMEQQTGSK